MDIKTMNVTRFLKELGSTEMQREESIERLLIEQCLRSDSPRELAVNIRTMLCSGESVWVYEHRVAKVIKAFLISLDDTTRRVATTHLMEPFFDEKASEKYPDETNTAFGVLIGILQAACWLEIEATEEEGRYFVLVLEAFDSLLKGLFRQNGPSNTSIGVLITGPTQQPKGCLDALSKAAHSFVAGGSEPRKIEKLDIVDTIRKRLIEYADVTVASKTNRDTDKLWCETGEAIMSAFLTAATERMPLYLRMSALNGLDTEKLQDHYRESW